MQMRISMNMTLYIDIQEKITTFNENKYKHAITIRANRPRHVKKVKICEHESSRKDSKLFCEKVRNVMMRMLKTMKQM